MPRISRLGAAFKLLAVLSSVGLANASSTRTLRGADGFFIIPGSQMPPPGQDTFTIISNTPSPSQTQLPTATIPSPVASPTSTPTVAPIPTTTKPSKTIRKPAAALATTPAPAPTLAPTKQPLVTKVVKKKRYRRRLPSSAAAVSVWLEDAE